MYSGRESTCTSFLIDPCTAHKRTYTATSPRHFDRHELASTRLDQSISHRNIHTHVNTGLEMPIGSPWYRSQIDFLVTGSWSLRREKFSNAIKQPMAMGRIVAVYPSFDRDNYIIWTVKLSIVLKDQILWDPLNLASVENAKWIVTYARIVRRWWRNTS